MNGSLCLRNAKIIYLQIFKHYSCRPLWILGILVVLLPEHFLWDNDILYPSHFHHFGHSHHSWLFFKYVIWNLNSFSKSQYYQKLVWIEVVLLYWFDLYCSVMYCTVMCTVMFTDMCTVKCTVMCAIRSGQVQYKWTVSSQWTGSDGL